MAYPYLDKDFDEKEYSGWVTVPNKLWDNRKARGLYQEYIDQLAYADELGFDGMVLNEHHQNIYGLMPSPNMIASALTQCTTRGKIVVLGNLLPLHMNPMRVAEEYAMLDQMSNGRLIAGFAPGGGPETFNYDVPSANTREKFWEAADLIVRSWTEDGPFAHEALLSFTLREPVAQAAAKAFSAGVDSRLAQPIDNDRSRQARLLLFSVFAQPRRRDPPGATGICRGFGETWR
jgi:alkanesulfonate monooxygenase SsuD/methylene tetrahydromethanopterin reductase-like flavin-dependent oxidoreductase (luciferase family)